MEVLDGLKEIEYEGSTCIAIGKFDGIHAGHQKLIKELTDRASDMKSVIFTFTFSSSAFSGKDEKILNEEERLKKFSDLGIDYLIEYDLNESTSKMEPEEFAREILKGRLHCALIVCGSDLSFGYKGRGNVSLLKSMEEELNIKVHVIEKMQYQGEDISSSRIREALKTGKLKDAEEMLRG